MLQRCARCCPFSCCPSIQSKLLMCLVLCFSSVFFALTSFSATVLQPVGGKPTPVFSCNLVVQACYVVMDSSILQQVLPLFVCLRCVFVVISSETQQISHNRQCADGFVDCWLTSERNPMEWGQTKVNCRNESTIPNGILVYACVCVCLPVDCVVVGVFASSRLLPTK